MSTNRITFADVQKTFDDALLLADRDIVRLMAAVVLANQMDGNPVWFMIVASSSGGKTAMLMTLDGLEFEEGKPMMTYISDLTENTFASGFKTATGSASLLDNIPRGGLFVFKDFTSLLAKRGESQAVIMSQLREIYDGKFDKKTGNNQDTAWVGKAGAIAGVTEAVHEYLSEMSVMGDRFLMYSPTMPDRKKLLNFIFDMRQSGKNQEELLGAAKGYMQRYLLSCLPYIESAKLEMEDEDKRHLMDVADFVTLARSGVFEDSRTGAVTFVPSPEMPTRLIDQLIMIGTALCMMRRHDGEENVKLTKRDMLILYKIAFDSIPIKRVWALKKLATYAHGVSVSGLSAELGYTSEVVSRWLDQLTSLQLVTRRKKVSGYGELYVLNSEFVDIMVTFQNVVVKEDALESNDEEKAQSAEDDFNSYGTLD